jgi:hypothetical protein
VWECVRFSEIFARMRCGGDGGTGWGENEECCGCLGLRCLSRCIQPRRFLLCVLCGREDLRWPQTKELVSVFFSSGVRAPYVSGSDFLQYGGAA